MVSVYLTKAGWFCSCKGRVTYYKELCEAMHAAYRQTDRDGASEQGDPDSNNG